MKYNRGMMFRSWTCETYMLVQVEDTSYTLINMNNGNRYVNPVSLSILCKYIDDCKFELISHCEEVTSDIINIAMSISELVEKKNKDYGNSFKNTVDKYGVVAYCLRIEDKINRLNTLSTNNEQCVHDENIEDTLNDICGYTLLMIDYLDKLQ